MTKTNETFNISSLTRDEILTILESLLFTSSVDVCAEIYKEDALMMLDIAKKIRNMFPDLTLENINIIKIKDENGDLIYHDEHTLDIVSSFPEILQEVTE